MPRVSLKNTFISFVQDSSEDEGSLASPSWGSKTASPRARSADCSPRGSTCSLDHSFKEEQMERLNKLWDTDELRLLDGPAPTDLKHLQRRLEEICHPPHGAGMKFGSSSCSLSTMEGDPVEGSTITPCSECPVDQPEHGAHMEFDLTIEEESVQPSVQTGRFSPVKPVPPQHNKEGPMHRGEQVRPMLREYLHGHVPRNMDLAMEYQNTQRESPPTTLMIRNIPNRYTQRELILELDDLGFAGTFDFLYIPLDKGTMMNVGYAFVNFVGHEWAEKCMQMFKNYRFKRHRKISGKIAAVSVAHIQGLVANLAHYENAAVNTAKLKQRRPVVLANISRSLGPEEEPADKRMQ
mmetsp:Transcript_31470/g.68935  ORF Transcript_31470/g.68935 Transcript_31470/m.68935 type:complete len:351 (+) Transcript_31470:87-1139(+)